MRGRVRNLAAEMDSLKSKIIENNNGVKLYLDFNPIQFEHSGEYSCGAYGQHGVYSMSKVTVLVRGK